MSTVELLLLLPPILLGSTFLHELGHAACALASGFDVTAVGIGMSDRPWFVRVGGVRVFFGLRNPLGGLTFMVHRRLRGTRAQGVAAMIGGVLANLAAAALFASLVWARVVEHPFFFLAACMNGMLVVVALWPATGKIGGALLLSDGAMVLHVLRFGWMRNDLLMGIRMSQALDRFWSTLDDRLMRSICHANAAMGWFDLGDQERAWQSLDRAVEFSDGIAPVYQAVIAEVRGTIIGRQDPVEGEKLLAEAEATFRRLGLDHPLCDVALVRADVLLGRGESAAALLALTHLASNATYNPPATPNGPLLARLARASCRAEEGPDPEPLLARYEALPRALRAPLDELPLYAAMARRRRQQGNLVGAADGYVKALAAADQIDASLGWLPEARLAFRGRVAELLAEASEALRAVSRPDEAARWVERLASTESIASTANVPEVVPLRYPIGVFAFNVLVILVALIALIGAPDAKLLQLLPMILGFFTGFGAFCLVVLRGAREASRARRSWAGLLALIIGLIPWFLCGIILAIVLLARSARAS